MIIFIEYVIIDNFFIDFVILFLTKKTIKSKICVWKISLGALVGALTAICIPFVQTLGNVVAWLFKALALFIMTCCLQKITCVRKFFCVMFFILLYTFLLGGIVIAIIFLISGDLNFDGMIKYSSNFPVGVLIFGVFILLVFGNLLLEYIKKRKIKNTFCYDIFFKCGDGEFKGEAFLDSGNSLIDPVTNFPIVVISQDVAFKMFKEQVFKLHELGLESFHSVEFSCANSVNSKMNVFLPTKFLIYFDSKENILKEVMIGVSEVSFEKKVLLNANMF